MGDFNFILSDQTLEALVLALALGMPEGFTEQDAQTLVAWAEKGAITAGITELAEKRLVTLRVMPNGEIAAALLKEQHHYATNLSAHRKKTYPRRRN